MNTFEEIDEYFQQQKDAIGFKRLTALQKCTAMRLLTYDSAADSVDEHVRLGSSTAQEALKSSCASIDVCFGPEYLRQPTEVETIFLLRRAAVLGFPGMLGSIDCCKCIWKNCPTAPHGQHKGKEGAPTLTMEAVADDRLRIWHMFLGMPGLNNDVNVFDASPLQNKIADGVYPLPF